MKTVKLRITTAKQGGNWCTAKICSRGCVEANLKAGSKSGTEISNLRSVVLPKETPVRREVRMQERSEVS